jgi:cell division protein FtsW
MTDSLRLPWDGDPDAGRREVAPSVFRPRTGRANAARLRSHASRPAPRPPESRSRAASVSRATTISRATTTSRAVSATVAATTSQGTARASGHASREVARDRVPGRVVQGPQRERHEPDYLLLVATAALTAMGILMVYSSQGVTTAKADGDWSGSVFTAVATQLSWAIVGVVVLLVAMRIDYRYWRAFSVLGIAIAVAFLVLVFVDLPPLIEAIDVRGARRWLQIGSLPAFHPAEFAKLALVVYLAHWLTRRGSEVSTFRRGLLPFLGIVGLVAGLVLLEPDLGTAGVIVLTAFAMFFVAGASLQQWLLLIPVGLAVAAVGVKVVLKPYQLERLTIFLDPWSAPLEDGFQSVQGLYALALGGVFGQGLGQTRQPSGLTLPAAQNDFIFAVVGQEFGLVGGLLVIALFLLLAWRGIRIAMHAPDTFGGLLALGITAWLTFQALINIGVVILLVPLTGMPLPFLSDGGTSLVVVLAAVGILLSISRESVPRGSTAHEDPDRSRGHRRPHLPRPGHHHAAGDATT